MNQTWDTRPWWRRARDVLSVGLNVLCNGATDETFSSRCYRSTMLDIAEGRSAKRRWRIAAAVVEALFWPWDRGAHCRWAFNEGIVRAGIRYVAAQAHLEQAATPVPKPVPCAADRSDAASPPDRPS